MNTTTKQKQKKTTKNRGENGCINLQTTLCNLPDMKQQTAFNLTLKNQKRGEPPHITSILPYTLQ